MKEMIKMASEIVNLFHDLLVYASNYFGLNLSDKDLHFWIFGLFGVLCLFVVHVMFKWVAKWRFSTLVFSFIYTLSMIIILAFAVEIQQGITNRGNIEFEDAVMSIWGFVVFGIVYGIIFISTKLLKRKIR